jgi:Tol biopolymer transport system component
MKSLPVIAAVVAVFAASAAAASPPLAKAPGIVVSHGGTIWIGGRAVVKGTQPVWSPDGSRIAYIRDGEVRVARAEGSNERRLTTRKPGLHWPANSPAWSPDGTTIAFGGTRDIYTVRLADGKLTNLTRSRESWRGNFTPAYSPNGRLIAFARSTDAFNSDIFVMTRDGKNLRRVTRSRGTDSVLAEEHGPTWSPDGKTLVFVTNRDQPSFELYAIGANGRGERKLTSTATPRYDEDFPRYSRDGTRILYVHDGRAAVLTLATGKVRELGRASSADWR